VQHPLRFVATDAVNQACANATIGPFLRRRKSAFFCQDFSTLFWPGQRQDQKEERLQPRFYSGL